MRSAAKTYVMSVCISVPIAGVGFTSVMVIHPLVVSLVPTASASTAAGTVYSPSF